MKMYSLSDVFLVLPGGIGTLDEMTEVLTWNQLGIHSKKVIIGNYVQFGVNVNVWDNDFHSIDFVERRKNIGIKSQPVVIDDDVWIGANSTILKGVHIGKGSVIASNSLVNKNKKNHKSTLKTLQV